MTNLKISPSYITYVSHDKNTTDYHNSNYCIIGNTKNDEYGLAWRRVAIAFYKLPAKIKNWNVSNLSVLFPFESSTSNDEPSKPAASYSIVTADDVPTGSLTFDGAYKKGWTNYSDSPYTAYAGSEVIDATNKVITFRLDVDTSSGDLEGVSAIQLISDTDLDPNVEYYLRVTLHGTKSYRYYKSVAKSNIVLNIDWELPDRGVDITYPKNSISVNSASNTVLSWDYVSGESSFGVASKQTSYSIVWAGGGGAGTLTGGSESYCIVPANTFPIGTIKWNIMLNDDFGGTVYDSAEFIAAGATGAPNITSVTTNTATPKVTWTVASQDCYQVQFFKDDELIHDSGLKAGNAVRTYTIPEALPVGAYYVKVRVINTYGYYTDYTSYAFILNYTEPTAPEYVNASITANYAVEISGDIPAGTTVSVLRTDEDGKNIVNLGTYDGNPVKDYTTALNRGYRYVLAALDSNNRLALSEASTAMVRSDGCVIHDTRDYTNWYHLHITDADMFEITRQDTQSKTFAQVIGRRFPIKEQMDYIISTRQLTCFVYDDEYAGLTKLVESGASVYFRATGEAFLADLTISDRGVYISGGRLVTIQLTRLSE